jgi:hypothetical protein
VAEFKKRIEEFLKTPAGIAAEVLVYAVMMILVLIFFTGNGQFIYEAF